MKAVLAALLALGAILTLGGCRESRNEQEASVEALGVLYGKKAPIQVILDDKR